jgi:hypothetical protein
MLSLLRRRRGAGTNRAVDPGRGLRTGARGRPRERSAARGLRPATHWGSCSREPACASIGSRGPASSDPVAGAKSRAKKHSVSIPCRLAAIPGQGIVLRPAHPGARKAFNPEAWARPGSRITPRIGCEARLPRSRGDLFPRCACTRVPWLLPRNQPRPTHRRKRPRRE